MYPYGYFSIFYNINFNELTMLFGLTFTYTSSRYLIFEMQSVPSGDKSFDYLNTFSLLTIQFLVYESREMSLFNTECCTAFYIPFDFFPEHSSISEYWDFPVFLRKCSHHGLRFVQQWSTIFTVYLAQL